MAGPRLPGARIGLGCKDDIGASRLEMVKLGGSVSKFPTSRAITYIVVPETDLPARNIALDLRDGLESCLARAVSGNGLKPVVRHRFAGNCFAFKDEICLTFESIQRNGRSDWVSLRRHQYSQQPKNCYQPCSKRIHVGIFCTTSIGEIVWSVHFESAEPTGRLRRGSRRFALLQ